MAATTKRSEGIQLGATSIQEAGGLQEGRRVQAGHKGEEQITLSPKPEAYDVENKLLTLIVVICCTEPQRTEEFTKKEERKFLKRRPRFIKAH